MKECYAEYGLEPIIQVSDNAFKITLPNVNYPREIQAADRICEQSSYMVRVKESREEAVIRLLEQKKVIVRKASEIS